MAAKEQAMFEDGIHEPIALEGVDFSTQSHVQEENAYQAEDSVSFNTPVYQASRTQSVASQKGNQDNTAQVFLTEQTEHEVFSSGEAGGFYTHPQKTGYEADYIARYARPSEPISRQGVRFDSEGNVFSDNSDTLMGYVPDGQTASASPPMTVRAETKGGGQYYEPVHPGIDYQEMSKRYGWDEQPSDENSENANSKGEYQWNSEDEINQGPPVSRRRAGERESRRRARRGESPLSKVAKNISATAKKVGKKLVADEEEEIGFDKLLPPVDKRHAFHGPVYPGSWQEKTAVKQRSANREE